MPTTNPSTLHPEPSPAALPYNSTLSLWLSVDPLSDKYPNLSPYVYCADNPVRLVDVDGRDVYVVGEASSEVISQINNQTSRGFKVSINEDGKMAYTGKARTDIDKMIKAAIDDKDITVNILADNSNDFGGIKTAYGGAYMGNSYEDGKVCTDQYVAPSILADFDKSVGDMIPGITMIHELAESYYGGQIAIERKEGSPFYTNTPDDNYTYDEAHFRANQIAIGNRGEIRKTIPVRPNPEYNRLSPISPYNSPLIPGASNVRIGWKRITDKNGM